MSSRYLSGAYSFRRSFSKEGIEMAIREMLVNGSFLQLQNEARELGRCKSLSCFEEFLKRLASLGMEKEEASVYWDAIDNSTNWIIASDDRQVATEYGILLDARKFPRNLLLYRLVELMFPNILRVSIQTIPHANRVLSGRWEYAGVGKKNVMILRFPSAFTLPKSEPSSRKRRHRTRSYGRDYY
jgi:hypothetical protein